MLIEVPAVTLKGLPEVLIPAPGAAMLTLWLALLNVVLPLIDMLLPPLVAMLNAPVPAVGADEIVKVPASVRL